MILVEIYPLTWSWRQNYI